MAALGLFVIAPKYAQRKAGIDLNYQGRQQAWRNQQGDRLREAPTRGYPLWKKGLALGIGLTGTAVVLTMAYSLFRGGQDSSDVASPAPLEPPGDN